MLATRDDFVIPYPVATIGVEKLNKQSMFQDANDKLSKRISRTVCRCG